MLLKLHFHLYHFHSLFCYLFIYKETIKTKIHIAFSRGKSTLFENLLAKKKIYFSSQLRASTHFPYFCNVFLCFSEIILSHSKLKSKDSQLLKILHLQFLLLSLHNRISHHALSFQINYFGIQYKKLTMILRIQYKKFRMVL